LTTYGLSKSRILAGLQCPKRLYLAVHQPQLADDFSHANSIIAVGNRVGELARTFYAQGVLVEHQDDLGNALKETQSLLAKPEPGILFEPAFQHQGVLIRADILTKDNRGLGVIEVKSSSRVKDTHIQDCAIQAWVMGNAGYPLEHISVAHINKEFVYAGDGSYEGLLALEDVTTQVSAIQREVTTWVDNAQKILSGEVPETPLGDYCRKPYACFFLSHCSSDQPEFPVTLLPRGHRIASELLAEGIHDIRDIPEGRLANAKHERIRRITKSGQPEVDAGAAQRLAALGYPRYYLDFETVNFAIPVWPNTRPYQTFPFQWSCHIEDGDGNLQHAEFLAPNGEPPMRALAEKLVDTLADTGPVFMYTPVEKTVIRQLAALFPELEEQLTAIVDRLVDLHPLAENHYYHPYMKGSWSIKSILPTIATDLSYNALDGVQDGLAAANAYSEMIDPRTSDNRQAEIRASLLKYCKLDTLAMVRLAAFLQSH